MSEQGIPVLAGATLATLGVAHFVRPQLFEGVTKLAFPVDTNRHLLIDGGIETAIGVGLVVPATRRAATVAAVAYVGYLAVNAVRNR